MMGRPTAYAIRSGFQSWGVKLSYAISNGDCDRDFLMAFRPQLAELLNMVDQAIEGRGSAVVVVGSARADIVGAAGVGCLYDQVSSVRVQLLEQLAGIDGTMLGAICGELELMVSAVRIRLAELDLVQA